MQRTLVSFDTDRIKGYVFGTDKLKEIRGASAILDSLNREDMYQIAKDLHPGCKLIYTNGGSGLFLIEADKENAEKFAQQVQQRYRKRTQGGASIAYVIEAIPEDPSSDKKDLEDFMEHKLENTLEVLRYRMRQKKDSPSATIALPSHPFMRPCAACGVNYAEKPEKYDSVLEDEDGLICESCRAKRKEDNKIKKEIFPATQRYKKGTKKFTLEEIMAKPLWDRIIYHLREDGYNFPSQKEPERPADFNVFREFSKSKEYIGLIYADGNNMGALIDELKTLAKIQEFSLGVDQAIHQAMSAAITQFLPIEEGNPPLFPFDVLLLGGDDLVMVTDAAKAMDVALMIAKKFRELSKGRFTLSVGVVLAPVKYPFSLLQDLGEETLKAAKKASAKARVDAKKASNKAKVDTEKNKIESDDTRISYLLIAGSSVHSYKRAVGELKRDEEQRSEHEFHATLRPYDPETLQNLLDAIHLANTSGINRSKLHQMREAILKMNLTTSVSESIGVLRNWQPKQREQVVNQLYKIGSKQQNTQQSEQKPFSDFPRVTFPWFLDGQNEEKQNIYRTSILDFIELYDFVSREE